MRELRGLGRAEQAFFEPMGAMEAGHVEWSDVADGVVYADQSHFCRQTRRMTGYTRETLRRRIVSDETGCIGPGVERCRSADHRAP